MMRGTVWGDWKTLSEALPRFRESKESLLWLANLLRVPLLSLAASQMSLVRLWLRLLVRTSRGRVAMVRDLDTSSCSQVLNDSFMADGCWWYKRKERNKRKRRTNWRECKWMKACNSNHLFVFFLNNITLLGVICLFFTFSSVRVVIGSGPKRLLCDLPLLECLDDDILLTESADLLPKCSISTSFRAWRTQQKMQQILWPQAMQNICMWISFHLAGFNWKTYNCYIHILIVFIDLLWE